MNILIVSDNPASRSFLPILRLKEDIEELIGNQTDLIALSSNGILFNQSLTRKEPSLEIIHSAFKNILEKKVYRVYVFSLISKYLDCLFSGEADLLNLIHENSPQAALFVFGASKMLSSLRTERGIRDLFLFPRPGVAKLTSGFRNEVLDYVRTISRKSLASSSDARSDQI